MNQIPPADLQALIRDKYGGIPPITEAAKAAFKQDMQRLTAGEPLAYVIGWVPFLGVKIYLQSVEPVTNDPGYRNQVLIPRPETEWWTEKLIKHLQEKFADEPFELLDLCAGSGAIGLAVLHALPNAFVSFGEREPAHAAIIARNLVENNLSTDQVSIHTGDLFAPFEDEQFDVIATNPPYIPEARILDKSVATFEPHSALFSGPDGLSHIRKILTEAPAYLVPHGEIWIEADVSNSKVAQEIAIASGYQEPTIHDDHYGRSRLLVAHFE